MPDIIKNEITNIIEIIDSDFTSNKKKTELNKLNQSGHYTEIIEKATQLVDGKISRQEFDEKLEIFEKKQQKQVKSLQVKAVECAINEIVAEEIQNNPNKTPDEIRAEISEKLENSATMNEVINNKENFATLSENENENFELAKKAEKAKLKKLYEYKVEGQITSNIKELDDFLKIIQPLINQAIIQPWKLVYATGDALTSSKEALVSWDKERKDLKNAWKTWQVMGLIDENDKITFGKGNSKVKNILAGKLHAKLLDDINKDIYDELINDKAEKLGGEFITKNNVDENWTDKEKADYEQKKQNFIDKGLTDYKNSDYIKNGEYKRTKVFDTSQRYEEPKNAINNMLLDLIRNHCRDGEKITDDGKKYIDAFGYVLDLFNTDNNDYILNKYCEDVEYIATEAKKGYRFEKGLIENEDQKNITEEREKKSKDDDITDILKKAFENMKGK